MVLKHVCDFDYENEPWRRARPLYVSSPPGYVLVELDFSEFQRRIDEALGSNQMIVSDDVVDHLTQTAYRGHFAGREAVLLNAPAELTLEALEILARTDPCRFAVSWQSVGPGVFEYRIVSSSPLIDCGRMAADLSCGNMMVAGMTSMARFKLTRDITY